ncbi:hypothetical protein PC129_g24777 [Phytophthora cactorum]|uniref:RxLR effector protein n=1 Tax=Phytophthora cactorum TaxID=29920 RepID=A0A8T1EAS1_9STRA|nr:hypothetical protein PC111_g24839 [Phytophthora cactorum]KAG2776553.1 hypothetical protein PC112_g25133 [Phytophthora cactorum]KAG2797673.1 hypothetical protein PC113_g24990 [Phytophthora cactorum]KAG2950309.1 hypothetical protein PC118_g25266 [Phytophthora cactorum]KAG2956027.1 hypothetical protein PC119_g27843 [Phytophthora cactorum]
MKLYIFVVLTAALLVIGEAIGTAGHKNHKLTDNSSQGILRSTGPMDDDATEEERGIQTSLFNKLGKAATNLPLPEKLQFLIWKKAKWDYKRLSEHFGFKGIPKEVYEKDPKFKLIDHAFPPLTRLLSVLSICEEYKMFLNLLGNNAGFGAEGIHLPASADNGPIPGHRSPSAMARVIFTQDRPCTCTLRDGINCY